MNRRRLLAVVAVTFALSLVAFAAAPGEKKPQKFARIAGPEGKPIYTVLDGEKLWEISGTPFEQWKRTDRSFPVSGVKFLAVTDARNVYALAGNYKDHLVGATPERLEKAKIPQFFMKSTSCLAGHGDDIKLPKDAGRVDYEGEVVVVIGKSGRNIPKERAMEHVLGVTAGNDVSAREWQESDIQWWRAKGSDTFGPCGPYIVTGVDYDKLDMKLRVNGDEKMTTNSSMMIHDISTAVSFLSQRITLHPGDLIFTGTAGVTQQIKPGDVVEVELEGVGVLRNKVVAGD